jgi:hypothetical protein
MTDAGRLREQTDQPPPLDLDLDAIERRATDAQQTIERVGGPEVFYALPDDVTGLVAELRAQRATVAALTAERDELQATFDAWWAAEMRGVAAWRAAHPGNDLVLPDTARFTVWLIEERDALREALTEVRHQFLDGAQVGWMKRMLDRVDAALLGREATG